MQDTDSSKQAQRCDRVAIYSAINTDGTCSTITQPLRAGYEPPLTLSQYGRVYVLSCLASGDIDTDAAILEAVRCAEAAGEFDDEIAEQMRGAA